MPLPSRFSNAGNLLDLVSRANHSRDFCSVREELFRDRLRLVSGAFALLSAVWVLVDAVLLPREQFILILPLMIALVVSLGLISLSLRRPGNWLRTSLKFNLFFGLILAFYLISKLLLPANDLEAAMIVGYHFAPFFLVTVLALFPMTAGEAIGHQGAVFLVYVGSRFFAEDFYSVVSLGETWLLGTMAVMVTGAQLSQLHLLLRLYREASYDVLTGLVNRRVFNKWLDREMEEAKASKRPLSLLLFDLDHFKKINDVHGHLIGDDVLRAFGALLNTTIRTPHVVARFGGEEFVAVLVDTDSSRAGEVAEEIRIACHHLNVTGIDGEPLATSVSIGVTSLHADDNRMRFIERVDTVLYDAKESGRDFVSVQVA